MRVTYKGTAAFSIDEECADIKEAFAFIGGCQNIFGAAESCPNCKGTDLRAHYKRVKDFDFYSLQCGNCKWELPFGQLKDGSGLFPKEWQPPYEKQGGSQTNQSAHQSAGKQKLEEEAPF